MKVIKIFIRFLKENGVYKNESVSVSLHTMIHYNNVFEPFNEFLWNLTPQGRAFWYKMSIQWLIYLFKRLKDLDKIEMAHYNLSREHLSFKIANFIKFYSADDKNNIEWYSDGAESLYEDVVKLIDMGQKPRL